MDRSPIYIPSRKSSTTSSESSAPYAQMITPNSYKEKLLPVLTKTASPIHHRHSARSYIRRKLRTPARTIALSAFLLSLLCLLLLALTSLLAFFYLQDLQGQDLRAAHEEVCMPCDEVRPNPLADRHSPLLDLLQVRPGQDDPDTQLCCASTAAQYAALFKLILKRQEEVKRLADVLGRPEEAPHGNGDVLGDPEALLSGQRNAVSAHLVHKPSTSGEDAETDDTVGVQQWKSPAESPMSHVRSGLAFSDSSKVTVLKPGLYFLYTQVLFNAFHKPPTSSLASTYVMRHSLAYPASSGILLKSRHTRYDDDTDRHSSYVGGLFFLHTGDELYVKVSIPEAVSHDDRSSFFGLFRVGD